jgi:hypothetical protein
MIRMDELKKELKKNGITDNEREALFNLMDEFDDKLYAMEEVSHWAFEERVYQIVSSKKGNYHFCEDFVRMVKEHSGWENLCIALYGNLSKNRNFKNLN